MMRFTEKTRENINSNYLRELRKDASFKLCVGDGLNGAIILSNNWMVCKVEDLSGMIEELTAMKQAIEDSTGVIL